MDRLRALKTYLLPLIIFTFNRFPIKKNKIFFISFFGDRYGYNPKYISEYILEHYPIDKFDLVWGFNDTLSKAPLTDFKKVKIVSLRYFYEICTSKIVISNARTDGWFVKRKGQYYIQTWHGGLGLKQIEKDAEDTLHPQYVEIAKRDSKKCDLLLSGCQFGTTVFKRSFWYDGEIFEHGTPRNDVFFQNNNLIKGEILNTLKIPDDYKVVMYAPTFRKHNNYDVYNLNYQAVLETLKDNSDEKWIILVRLHPNISYKSSQLVYGEHVINVSSYEDVQELLSVTDVLITDYSSLVFDFALTQRPCFLYVPDLVDYMSQDRKLYFDISELPFTNAVSHNVLLNQIQNFDSKEYRAKLLRFLNKIGSFEDGKACEHVLNRIEKVCFGEKMREIENLNRKEAI